MKVAWQVLIFISLHDMNNPSEVLASTLPLLSPGDQTIMIFSLTCLLNTPSLHRHDHHDLPLLSSGDHHHHHHHVLLSAQCREKKVKGSIMNNPTLH